MNLRRSIHLFVGCIAVLAVTAGNVQAVPVTIDPPGLPWYEFSFTGVGVDATAGIDFPPFGKAAGDPPWTFSGPANLLVTDAFAIGDIFEIFDFGVSLGVTSTPDGSVFAGNSDNPLDAFASGAFSSGTFALGAGAHSITIVPTASPFGGGGGYFQVQAPAVPEPATLALFGLGLAGIGFGRKRKTA